MLLKFGTHLVKIANGFVKRIKSAFTMSDFTSISTVYNSLSEGDSIALLIRHSERTDNTQELTDAGITYATNLGASLTGGVADINDIALYSTDVNRTKDTAYYIAIGRGDTKYTSSSEVDVSGAANIDGEIYLKTKNVTGWEDFSKFAYDETYSNEYYDKATISNQIIDYVKSNMTNTLNVFVTHDQLLEILTVYITNKQIALRFWDNAVNDGISEKRWITYLAGLAIIKRANGTYEIYPVKGLDRGFQRKYDNIYVPD